MDLDQQFAGADAQKLKSLATSPDENVRNKVARNSNTPLDTLIAMIISNDYATDIAAAVNFRHRDTAQETLSELARHESVSVRVAVAGHTKISEEALGILATDEHESVREEVARNTNSSNDVLKVLSLDKDDAVRKAAINLLSKTENAKVNSVEIGRNLT